ncbi:hypothetical protein LEN26_020881 [Aphanomyces euteiches]|nr:hypothetical protein LEN26_020881 [Aphanomyces euteiches]KAH9127869.1 hypothetical protein AeMF1_001888 [Aphanomyces euteiches]KAH9192775.1 hypothetical protein AeNC1_005246 [Aphanomyces euteiches]
MSEPLNNDESAQPTSPLLSPQNNAETEVDAHEVPVEETVLNELVNHVIEMIPANGNQLEHDVPSDDELPQNGKGEKLNGDEPHEEEESVKLIAEDDEGNHADESTPLMLDAEHPTNGTVSNGEVVISSVENNHTPAASTEIHADMAPLARAHSEVDIVPKESRFKMSKFATMPSMQKSMTFRLNPRPKSSSHATRGELQRFLSTPLHEDADYGSTTNGHNHTPEKPTSQKQRSRKQNRRLNRDRGMDNTKWDYVLVFPNPEYEKEKKEKQDRYPFIPTMNDMLTKLRQAGLDTQLSKSTNLDINVPKEKYIPPFVYCKLSAPIERLKEEAARVHMSIGLVENKLERMAKQGEVRFHIENPEDRTAEIRRQGHEPLPPEKITRVTRRPYKKIQFEAGREFDVFDMFDIQELENMDLEDPRSPSSKKKAAESPLSAVFQLFKRFRYRPYKHIHMTYTPQENVQNLYGTPLFPSIKRIRLIESIVRSVSGAGLDLDMLVQYGAIAAYYPVHDDEYCQDIRSTWSTSLWLTHQPIESTRDYLGGQAALFLAYVAHITRWLVFPSIFSVVLWFSSEQRYLVWVFGVLMVVWATMFLKMWKRKLAVLGMKWGLTDYHAQDHDRPEYDESINRHMPSEQFGSMLFFRRVFSFLVMVTFLNAVLATKASLFYFRWLSKTAPERFEFNVPMMQNKTISLQYGGDLHLVAIVNVLTICFWTAVFARVNSFLTSVEVHHTETSAQQAYIFKGVLFEFLNNFAGIFYIAFVKPHVEGIDGDFAGPDIEAVEELGDYMLYIYGFQLGFHVIIHVILPWVQHLCCLAQISRRPRLHTGMSIDEKSLRDIESAPIVQPKPLPVEVQFGLQEYGWNGLFQDYIAMVMQFGYATFFVVSCPYLPLMAFFYNLISIRAHSISLVTIYRRLTPRSAQHIRLWTAFLEFFCVIAIITNAWSVVAKAHLAQRLLDHLRPYGLDDDDEFYVVARSVCITGLVIGLYAFGKILGIFINDTPTRVQVQLERQEYYISKVLHLGYQWDKTMHSILFSKSQEELENEEGYGWDFAIVFPNPEVRRPPRLHPLTGKVEEVVSMRDMILKLHKAGLQVQFFESTAKVSSFIPSMVLCKIRANEKRLETEAHRVKMPVALNPAELEFQSKQGVVMAVWQRVRKHVQAIETEMNSNSLESLLLEIRSVTSEKADDEPPTAPTSAVTWDQLLAELYCVLNDMIKADSDIKDKFIELDIPNRHSSMVKLSTLSEELILKLIPQDDETETLEKQLLDAPRLLEEISAGLEQASKDIGVQISLLPILLPALARRKKEVGPMLPEHILQKTMEDLSSWYTKLLPLMTKMGHLLALTLPLPDLKTIETLLEKRDLAGLELMGEPNIWLRTELQLIHLMIKDTSLELPQLRHQDIVVDKSLSIPQIVQMYIDAVIANPMIDVSPFFLQNPDPKFKGLANKYRYGPYDNLYMTYQDKRDLQHWFKKTESLHGPMQLFNSTERLSLIESIITDSEDGAGLHLDKLLLSGAIKGYFPLHDDHMKADLWRKWKWSIHQPIEEIRSYFGVKIGLYFAYLGHYTTWLFLSALVGLSVFVIQLLRNKYFPPDIAENLNLSFVKVLVIPIYGVFIVIWATLFLKYWIRKQWVFCLRWGMSDFHEEEQVRPQFQGELMRDPATGSRMRYFSDKQRRWRLLFSWFILVILIGIVLVFVAFIFYLRFHFKGNHFFDFPYFGLKNIGTQCASMANVAQIFMMSQVYNYVCHSLNNFENHRTDSDYENHFVAKAIVFQFVNNFAGLFYVAFFKKIFENKCDDNDCMNELNISLTYVYASQLVVGNCQEVIMPLFWAQVEYFRHEWVKKSGDQEIVSAVETQFFMPEYGWIGTFYDYLEMIIQFGYSTFFVLACPLAPVFSFCNNIFEIRIDGSKISKFCRRPRPSGASTIGHWIKVLDVFVIITIVTNSWIITNTSEFGKLLLSFWPKFDEYFSTMGLFFTMIALLLGAKAVINFIPDMPRHVRAQLKRQKFVVSKILSTHDVSRSEEN